MAAKVDLSALKKANLPIVVLMGPPGAGKGTQAAKIKAKYSYTHLSTGDLLREEVKAGTPRGKQISDMMSKGELVPLDIVCELLAGAMNKAFAAKTGGFVLDGFPRDTKQAEEMAKTIGTPKVAICLEAADDVVTKRLIERGKTSKRVDDNPEAVAKCLATYKSQTIPVASFYEKAKILKKIPAGGDVESVFKEICKILDAK